jgi:hypothetical protein
MELDKKEIGQRLKLFAKEKFGGVGDLAEALNLSQPNLSGTYINGRSIPGGELLAKLSSLGCDINWLLTGQESVNSNSDVTFGDKAKNKNNILGNTGEVTVTTSNGKVYKIGMAEATSGSAEIELLRKENEFLKQRIQDLEEIIRLLKK